MTDSASEVGDRASEAQRGLTQQVSAELEVEPRSAGSQPFSHGALPLACPAGEQLGGWTRFCEGSGFDRVL